MCKRICSYGHTNATPSVLSFVWAILSYARMKAVVPMKRAEAMVVRHASIIHFPWSE